MTGRSTFRGNNIHFTDGSWCYEADGTNVSDSLYERPCGRCGNRPTGEGHDACLGTLPGVKNACCGHGDTEEAYIQFEDGRFVAGEEAIRIHRRTSITHPPHIVGTRTVVVGHVAVQQICWDNGTKDWETSPDIGMDHVVSRGARLHSVQYEDVVRALQRVEDRSAKKADKESLKPGDTIPATLTYMGKGKPLHDPDPWT